MNIAKILKHLLLDQFTLYGGGKGSSASAPTAPDPYTVANATTQTNDQTASYNKALNLNNYTNPFGSQQSVQTGTDPNTGAPIYNTSISASSGLQGLINNSMGAAGNADAQTQSSIYGLGGVNQGLSGINQQLQGLSGQINPAAAQQANQQGQQAAYSAQTQYLDPQFSQGQSSLESQLANQGLTPGSQAYTNAMTNFNNSKQQAYSNAANQSVLTGSQIGTQMLDNNLSAVGEQGSLLGQQGTTLNQEGTNLGQQASLAQLPYSQLSSLAGLVPGNTGTAQSAANPANIAQGFQNQYQGELNAYNTATGSSNSSKSGLFGLGSAAIPALSSML
jgi:hypothetical protein